MAKNINKNKYHQARPVAKLYGALYDPSCDAVYLGLQSGIEEEFREIAPGVGVELNAKGDVIGIEILHASQVFQPVLDHADSPHQSLVPPAKPLATHGRRNAGKNRASIFASAK